MQKKEANDRSEVLEWTWGRGFRAQAEDLALGRGGVKCLTLIICKSSPPSISIGGNPGVPSLMCRYSNT